MRYARIYKCKTSCPVREKKGIVVDGARAIPVCEGEAHRQSGTIVPLSGRGLPPSNKELARMCEATPDANMVTSRQAVDGNPMQVWRPAFLDVTAVEFAAIGGPKHGRSKARKRIPCNSLFN